MDSFTLAWLAWLAMFVVVETMALVNKRLGDTLSEHTRRWFATGTKGGRAAFIGVWLGFAAWYLVHIVAGA